LRTHLPFCHVWVVLPRPLGEVAPGLGATQADETLRVCCLGLSPAEEIWVTAAIPPKTTSAPTAASSRLLRALPEDRRAPVDLRIELLSFSIRYLTRAPDEATLSGSVTPAGDAATFRSHVDGRRCLSAPSAASGGAAGKILSIPA
jgi:hypothetical protein